MVAVTEEQSKKQAEINELKKQITVLRQRRLRLQNKTEEENVELKSVNRAVESPHSDKIKLNSEIHRRTGRRVDLFRRICCWRTRVVSRLKEAEVDCIRLEQIIDSVLDKRKL
eukprot:Clim_evm41s239 gene=Clim_evmTU41s239